MCQTFYNDNPAEGSGVPHIKSYSGSDTFDFTHHADTIYYKFRSDSCKQPATNNAAATTSFTVALPLPLNIRIYSSLRMLVALCVYPFHCHSANCHTV